MAKVELNVPQVPFSKLLVRPTVLVCSFYVTSLLARRLYHPVDEDERLSIVWYSMVWYSMVW